MEFMKINPSEISSELRALIDELKIHEARKENESDSAYVQRYYFHPLEREYRELPSELRAWIDENISLKEILLIMLTVDIDDLTELQEALDNLKKNIDFTTELSLLRGELPFALHLHKENEEVDGVYVNVVSSRLAKAWNDRQQRRADQGGETLAIIENVKRINTVAIDRLIYPLDKVNSCIWSILKEGTLDRIPIGVERKGSRKEINILYSINFDDLGENLQISKKLTWHDKRVYIAVAGLYNAGNEVMTLHQIHTAMGGTGNPSNDQRKKISTAITKMQSARISVDNSMEATAYNYEKFVYSSYLLPIERVKRIVNGNLVEEAIHLFREPPLMTFARQRKQITTIPIRLLNSPLSKTDLNLAIENYLIERISWARDGRSSCKILYTTICEKAGAVTAKQQQRMPEKVERYLTHCAKEGFIMSFKTTADGVTISF